MDWIGESEEGYLDPKKMHEVKHLTFRDLDDEYGPASNQIKPEEKTDYLQEYGILPEKTSYGSPHDAVTAKMLEK